MAIELSFELTISVANDEQAEKVLEAVESGIVEIAIKDRVFGHSQQVAVPVSAPAPNLAPASTGPVSASVERVRESTQTLEMVDTLAPKKEIKLPVEERRERTRGVLGARRISRTGGDRG